MTKTDEIALLDATIKRFGEQSYLGPWLAEIRQDLVADISNDVSPTPLLPSKARTHARLIVEKAERDAAETRKKADEYEIKVRDDAHRLVEGIKARARMQLELAAREIR